MPKTVAAATIIARGTSNAAFVQLTGCSATRTGTTATLTKTAHGRASNDKCLIQGFSLEEFNGVFNITVVDANTFTYVIKQDPGANPAGTPGTVDVVTLGTALNLTAGYGAEAFGGIQNTTVGPTIAPQLWMGVANGSAEADYIWAPVMGGDTTANSWTPIRVPIPMARSYVNFAVARNTGQAVDCFVLASHVTGV